jgi:hypothetical protein
MPRLCSHSSRSYPGRSARQGREVHGEENDQSGHWWNKPGRMGEAATLCERTRQQATKPTQRAMEQSLA